MWKLIFHLVAVNIFPHIHVKFFPIYIHFFFSLHLIDMLVSLADDPSCAANSQFNAIPVAESTRIYDEPEQQDPTNDQSDSNVGSLGNPREESSLDPTNGQSEVGNPSEEFSLDDPSIHEQSSSFALTYEIVEQSTKRGRQKLIDSRGYTYHVQRRRGVTTDWQCTVRGKVNPCRARIIQRGVANFEPGPHNHNHPAEVGAAMVARVTAHVKAKAVEDVFRPAAAIVDEVSIPQFKFHNSYRFKIRKSKSVQIVIKQIVI